MNFQWRPKKYLVKILKVVGWMVFSILGLLVLISLAIQIPYIQNKLTQKAITFLENKIGTDVNLEHISLSIPKKLVLTGLYIEDQQKDTLIYAGELAVNTNLWKLTNRTIELSQIELSDFNGNITRTENDSAFNFSYIIDAFTGDTTSAPADTTQAPWAFSIGEISLERIRVRFNDGLMGNDLKLQLGTLDLELEEFDLENSTVKADEITMENVVAEVTQSRLAADTVDLTPDTLATSTERAFNASVNEVTLKDIQVLYNHRATGQNAKLTVGDLEIEDDQIDLINRSILLDRLFAKSSSSKVIRHASPVSPDSGLPAACSFGFFV